MCNVFFLSSRTHEHPPHVEYNPTFPRHLNCHIHSKKTRLRQNLTLNRKSVSPPSHLFAELFDSLKCHLCLRLDHHSPGAEDRSGRLWVQLRTCASPRCPDWNPSNIGVQHEISSHRSDWRFGVKVRSTRTLYLNACVVNGCVSPKLLMCVRCFNRLAGVVEASFENN